LTFLRKILSELWPFTPWPGSALITAPKRNRIYGFNLLASNFLSANRNACNRAEISLAEPTPNTTSPVYNVSQTRCEDFMAQGRGARTLQGYGQPNSSVWIWICVFSL